MNAVILAAARIASVQSHITSIGFYDGIFNAVLLWQLSLGHRPDLVGQGPDVCFGWQLAHDVEQAVYFFKFKCEVNLHDLPFGVVVEKFYLCEDYRINLFKDYGAQGSGGVTTGGLIWFASC